ncbi:probable nucleoporin Nup54 [Teleopsis dalmanni]|uniref:probable nucleoporin Nup54 n=1 Tax=Teleopsis dalmanni TaxID=139649 RepID=UPI0018CDE6B7|nr:probable nucleoporin Nup54 [Teleopsis dalmanni]
MSVFGGNTSLGASSTPVKPGMFSSFGATAAVAPTFGATATSTAAPPAFGTTSAFGTTTGFGAPATSLAPTLGGFGTPAATSAPTLGGFGGFGTNTATTSVPTLGGFGGFGTNTAATSTAPSLFGAASAAAGTSFGGFNTATSSAAPTFGGFGTSTTNTGFGGFGATATTSTAPTFSGFNTQSQGFGGFNSTFGKPATSTVTPGFGGFGGNTSFMLGQPQPPVQQISPDEAFAQSIFNVAIFGDERDTVIAKWNYLQALWGVGKTFYSQNAPPVDITSENYLCRFKAMGYSLLPGKENKFGLVALNFNKPITEVKTQQNQLVATLNSILGNKPNLIVNIENISSIDEKKCQVVIYVEERSQISPNETKRVLATDLNNYLNQQNVRAQVNNVGVIDLIALVQPDEDQLKEYLDTPPKGIDARVWRQAKLDNPDPAKFIPIPMIGFSSLKHRIKCQEAENERHALFLKKIENDFSVLRQRHAITTAKIMEHKRKLATLSHHILKVIVKQECTRKVGLPLTPEEEALRTKLENMQALVSAPTQFKGRLSELLSQLRMQRNHYQHSMGEYTLDKDSAEDMKVFLAMQQKAIQTITETVVKDIKALQIIKDGLPELMRG